MFRTHRHFFLKDLAGLTNAKCGTCIGQILASLPICGLVFPYNLACILPLAGACAKCTCNVFAAMLPWIMPICEAIPQAIIDLRNSGWNKCFKLIDISFFKDLAGFISAQCSVEPALDQVLAALSICGLVLPFNLACATCTCNVFNCSHVTLDYAYLWSHTSSHNWFKKFWLK